MTYASYGTAPRQLNEFVSALSADERARVERLSAEVNAGYESAGLRRFSLTEMGAIDWTGVPVAAQAFADDDVDASRVFVGWARDYFPTQDDVVVFWGNFGIPSIKLPLALAVDRSDALFEVCDELWVFSPRAQLIFEKYHEGQMRLASIPPEA